MMETSQEFRVRTKYAEIVERKSEERSLPFPVRLVKHRVDHDEDFVYFKVEGQNAEPEHQLIQMYLNGFGGESDKTRDGAGDDSSYDSDCEAESRHEDVSRTVSDTLGAEYEEYVDQEPTPLATARLEFGLKLGYSENLVRAALKKLGPDTEQNELLAELIKLGDQQQSSLKSKKNSECDPDGSPSSEANVIPPNNQVKYRPIVIDGSNVAMSHGNKGVFSCRGIKICVNWFRSRGHTDITVFVPRWRKESPRLDNPVVDQEILSELEQENVLVFTPSREIGGKRLVCYDDRYILKLAAENQGVVVSNDNYRDLVQECPEFRAVVEKRILMYSFVNDRFMPPDDPLGRTGPNLENFLRFNSDKSGDNCPYGKKCTYGNKCKYNHPERGAQPLKSVTERMAETALRPLSQVRNADNSKKIKGKSLSLPLQNSEEGGNQATLISTKKTILSRTKSTNLAGVEQPQPMHFLPPAYTGPYYPYAPPPPPPSSERYSRLPTPSSEQNLHRKLQRQLSINPAFDSRVYYMQQCNNAIQGQHEPLSRHFSYQEAAMMAPPAPYHTNVARIASAPPTGIYWPPHSDVDDRLKLRYHLASIFPEERVDAAMKMYPNETNAQKICAAILTMFPNS